MSIFKLVPACKDYLWGGKRLKEEYKKQSDTEIIAETWELSCHPNGLSLIEGTQETLRDYIKRNPAATGELCKKYNDLPMLIKFIDAASPLSIQVHPNDTYAMAHGGQSGKMEMWYVIDCDPGATLYHGVKQETTPAQLKEAIATDTLCDLLNYVAVKKGDVFWIEPGTIHAIGAGILIAEVQQSSDVTYRVYDYGRIDADGKARQLHVKEACEVVSLKPSVLPDCLEGHLAKCPFFTVDLLRVQSECMLEVDANSFHSLLVLEGQLIVSWGDGSIHVRKGDSLLVEAGTGKVKLHGVGELLHTYLE